MIPTHLKKILKTHTPKMTRMWVFLFLLTASGLPLHAQSGEEVPEEWKTAVSSLDRILFDLYDVISGPAGQERDWDKFRYLCHPQARMMPIFPNRENPDLQEVKVHSLETFIEKSSEFTREHGFFEIETYKEVQTYGGLTHVWSHYLGRAELNGDPIVKGINSIQLFHDGARWWVMGIFWQPETPDFPMPKVER